MKNHRSAIAAVAAAASLALALSVSTPASAANVSGSYSCSNTAQVRVAITVPANNYGRILWERPGGGLASDSWIAVSYKQTLVYYARNLGTARWTIDSRFKTTATCVRL